LLTQGPAGSQIPFDADSCYETLKTFAPPSVAIKLSVLFLVATVRKLLFLTVHVRGHSNEACAWLLDQTTPNSTRRILPPEPDPPRLGPGSDFDRLSPASPTESIDRRG
jgi:hypothetical protein